MFGGTGPALSPVGWTEEKSKEADMKFYQLQALVSVVDHGGFRAAAHALSLSQVAVTKAIQTLEEECGTQLLVRTPSHTVPTKDGEYLVQRARIILRELAVTKETLAQRRGICGGSVRVGLHPAVTISCLGEALAWFRQRFPDTSIGIYDGGLSFVLPKLRENQLDFAIAALGEDWPSTQFKWEPLCTCRQYYAVRPGHPLLSRGPATAVDIAGYEWALIAQSFEEAQERFQAALSEPEAPMSSRLVIGGDAFSTLQLVKATDAIVIIPELALEPCGLVRLETGDELALPSTTLSLVTRRPALLTPAMEFMIHCFKETIRKRFLRDH